MELASTKVELPEYLWASLDPLPLAAMNWPTLLNRSLPLLAAAFVVFAGMDPDAEFTEGRGHWARLLILVSFPLSMIWFGELWNLATMGSRQRGLKIDSPTPPIAIALIGWAWLIVLHLMMR